MNKIKEFLHFTHSERNGALTLLVLCLALLIVRGVLPHYLQSPESGGLELETFAAAIKTEPFTAPSAGKGAFPVAGDSVPPSPQQKKTVAPSTEVFDPNTATREVLLRHQLPERVVRTLLNYREKGGRFYKSKDLLRVYGLTEEHYRRITPYIEITAGKSPVFSRSNNIDSNYTVDINRSTAEDWMRLRGIGPGYSRRILNFRDKLGGFSTIGQVADTYGLPDSTFQSVKTHLRISPVLRKLSVNRLIADSLARHPYINFRQARAIANYRRNHGPFNGPDDFRKVLILTVSEHDRLLPYLEFN